MGSSMQLAELIVDIMLAQIQQIGEIIRIIQKKEQEKKQTAGYKESWKANNIYDFAGNL